MTAVIVYTCSVGKYDWIHRPHVAPPGISFLRFSDQRPWYLAGWQHRDLPLGPGAVTARVMTRFPKLCPQAVLPECDIAVWIDSSVRIVGDITSAIRAFEDSGADVALFPHPGGRTVGEEFAHAIGSGRIPPALYTAAARQQERYKEAGVIDCKVVEATIIFYRLSNDTLRAACESWWEEVTTYTERDQVSQPYAMRDQKLNIHLWDWHFDEPNTYFRRMPHRPKNPIKRLRTGAHFLGDSRLDYRLAQYAILGAQLIGRTVLSLLPRS